jgi:hypothetical protein
MSRITKVAALTALLLLTWSAFFASTFRYPFYWDDFHLIRSYRGPEIRAAFHAVADPDKIETPGLRPCSILLYNLQGSLFGENIVAHRVFMVALMGVFMIAAGVLLLEVGLGFLQLTIVFLWFVSSRVFASVILWISLSHLILAYLWISLTAYSFIRWTKNGRSPCFVLMLVGGTLATFTREETYTLPAVLPLLWLISSFDTRQWRRVGTAALSLFAIVCFHYWLWHFLVPNALSPQFTLSAIIRLVAAMAAAWLPGGSKWIGFTDGFIGLTWIAFVIGIILLFLRLADSDIRWRFFGTCCLGGLLSLPALGVARSYSIALPTVAFMSAISIAIGEIYHQIQSRDQVRNWKHHAITSFVVLGIAVGIVAGIDRSKYVAESMEESCAVRVVRDGQFLFNLFEQPATIPESRRQAGLARLKRYGIESADDLRMLDETLDRSPEQYRQARANSNGLFLPKYKYLSF